MITFEKIIISNFMSIGNSPITVDYQKNKTTLISAKNGEGKSSLAGDSLCFVLYGKAYRDVNKANLINSINGKNLLVEVHFSVGNTKYVVKRGIKPNIFEIWKNDKLLNQDSASKDYQKILENNILKMNYRTFTQIVLMGSGNYIPFMKLTTAQRREFVEDILDIKVFSTMNKLLKQYVDTNETRSKEIQDKINRLKDMYQMQESFIATLEHEKESRIADIQKNIKSTADEIKELTNEIELLTLSSDQLSDFTKNMNSIASKAAELNNIQQKLKSNIEKQLKEKEFYVTVDTCPTCYQGICEEHKEKIIGRVNSKITTYQNGLDDLSEKIKEISIKQQEIFDLQKQLNKVHADINTNQSSIQVANRMIQKYQKELTSILANNSSTTEEKNKLIELSKEIKVYSEKRVECLEQKSYHDVAYLLLRDNGIKTKIIEQYIPLFNQLIQKYLDKMELFVQFTLDVNFNEKILSRHRDSFTYDSFSAGEKQRIDLALLFTFREIAKRKSAVDVNLLMMDETLDASLDSQAIDSFFDIIGELKKTNLFVVSHRALFEDKFDSVLRLEKRNNFTVLV